MKRCLTFFLLCLLTAITVHGGRLDGFESDATAPRTDIHSHGHHSHDHSHAFWEAFLEALFEGVFDSLFDGVLPWRGEGVLSGAPLSWKRVRPRDRDILPVDLRLREAGEALIPFARLDVGYQFVESGLSAIDYRGEIGYGALALQVRHTRFHEESPADDMDISQVHFLYRLSFGNSLELDLGFGKMTIEGNSVNNGFSYTMPFLYHPSDSAGIEFRPSWSWINGSRTGDHDLSVLVGRRHVSLRVGYRWIQAPTQSLNGPHAGLSVRF